MKTPWLSRLPALRGEITQDEGALEIAELDFGKVRRRRPAVVVRPAEARDVLRVVRFCKEEGLPVAARGAAHSAGGQMMASQGVVIDMKSMSRVLSLSDEAIEVEGGIMWRQVLEAVLARKRSVPVVTDWLSVTVGGTLSMGGFGFMSFHRGTQMDHILEMDVVTGEGKLVTCSPTRNAELFDIVRGTHGQFGFIVRVKIGLEPAPRAVRVTQCAYGDVRAMMADFTRLTVERGCDLIHAFAAEKTQASILTKMNSTEQLSFRPEDVAAGLKRTRGNWVYNLELCDRLYARRKPARPPLDPATLQCLPGLHETWTMSWKDFCFRLPPLILEEQYRGAAPHPEICVLIPLEHAGDFLSAEMKRLHPRRDIGNGPVLLFPIDRRLITPSLFMLPQGHTYSFFFGLLRRADPPTRAHIKEQVADNERIYRTVRELGGVRYCCDVTPESRAFWADHYGVNWERLGGLKRRYDPAGIFCSSWGRAVVRS